MIKKHLFMLTAALAFLFYSCDTEDPDVSDRDLRQDMRDFVIGISQYAKIQDSDFIIIPQNGQELVTSDGNENGTPVQDYLGAIDGVGREDLFYGYSRDNRSTDPAESAYLMAYLDICKEWGVSVFVTDYCSDEEKIDDSYSKNLQKEYISFAAPDRELNLIPEYPASPYRVNNADIETLADAHNFLYLLNPENYSTKQDFINAISATDYDVIIMDFYFEGVEFSAAETAQMKTKKNGGKRLLISYMSIGEAEDYRFYWKDTWEVGNPSWIQDENKSWKGNYIVKYWDDDWQSIIYGNNDSYLMQIINAGFDGVYLDIIDAFEYFE